MYRTFVWHVGVEQCVQGMETLFAGQKADVPCTMQFNCVDVSLLPGSVMFKSFRMREVFALVKQE